MKETDFCPICRYYLYLKHTKENDQLRRECHNCGYNTDDVDGLILEIDLKEKTSEGYKILMNEFTKHDPTLPHVNTIKCPNVGCESNTTAKEKDVIYLKHDAINMKFLYICNLCDTQWKSKA